MRNALASILLALLTALVACSGSEARGPDRLFDTSRSDVKKFKGDDGRELGLVNTTYHLLWDYEHGYSRFGEDHAIVWGPVANIPEADLQSIESKEAAPGSTCGVGQTSSALTYGGGGGTGLGGGHNVTVCSCCYVRLDGTCGCLLCTS